MDIISLIRRLFTGTRYGYTAYVLTPESRERLLKAFPPKYSEVIAEHITVDFGVPETAPEPPRADITVMGYADAGDGLEALILAVGGSMQRPDGSLYHITLSLDRKAGYTPKDSNSLAIRKWITRDWEDGRGFGDLDTEPGFIRFKS